MGVHRRHAVGELLGALRAFVLIFAAQGQPLARRPEQIGAAQGLLPGHTPGSRRRAGEIEIRHLEIALGHFDAAIDIGRETLVDAAAITPRAGAIDVIVKLVEARHLRGLQGLIGDQRTLQGTKTRSAEHRAGPRFPGHTGLGVELIADSEFLAVTVEEIAAAADGHDHMLERADIGVAVGIDVARVGIDSGGEDGRRWKVETGTRVDVRIDVEVTEAGRHIHPARAEQMLQLAAKGLVRAFEVDQKQRRAFLGLRVAQTEIFLLVGERSEHRGAGREIVANADAIDVLLVAIAFARREIVREEAQGQIASRGAAMAVFGLQIGLRRQLVLREGVGNVVALIGVGAKAVGGVMHRTEAEREVVIQARHHTLAGIRVVLAYQAAALETQPITAKDRVELIEGQRRRTAGADQEQIALGQAWLDRCGIERLQQLRLQEFTDARDFVTRLAAVGIGQKTMGGKIRGIGIDRSPTFDQCALLKAEIGINTRDTCAACGEIGIEQLPGAIHRAVIVQADRLLQRMQRHHRLIVGLCADRFVEVGGRIGRIQLARDRILLSVQRTTFFFVIGLAQIRPEQRVATIQRDGRFQRAPSVRQLAALDQRQAQTEVRERIGRGARDGLREMCASGQRVVGRQFGETEHQLGLGEIRRQGFGLAGRLQRLALRALHQPELGQARLRQSIIGVRCHCGQQRLACGIELQSTLLRVGQSDSGSHTVVSSNRVPRVGERRLALVLHQFNHRPQRQREAGLRIDGEGRVDCRARGLDLTDVQQQARARQFQRGIGRLAAGRRERGERGLGVAACGTCQGRINRRVTGKRRISSATEGREQRRIVKRPLHGIAGAHQGLEHGGGTGFRGSGLPTGQKNFACRVGGSDLAFEDLYLRALIGDTHGEFSAFDHAVHVRRVDGHGARRTTERLESADHELEQTVLLGPVADIDQAHGGVLVETQYRVIDELDRSSAVEANADRIPFAQDRAQARSLPFGLLGMRHFHRAFERSKTARAHAALVRRYARPGCKRNTYRRQQGGPGRSLH